MVQGKGMCLSCLMAACVQYLFCKLEISGKQTDCAPARSFLQQNEYLPITRSVLSNFSFLNIKKTKKIRRLTVLRFGKSLTSLLSRYLRKI